MPDDDWASRMMYLFLITGIVLMVLSFMDGCSIEVRVNSTDNATNKPPEGLKQ